MKKKVTERPVHPDGRKYYFNCCVKPDIRWQSPKQEEVRCENCGHEWTDMLQ